MAPTVDILDGSTFVVSDERGDLDGSDVGHLLLDIQGSQRSFATASISDRVQVRGDRPVTLAFFTLAARSEPAER